MELGLKTSFAYPLQNVSLEKELLIVFLQAAILHPVDFATRLATPGT